MKLRRFLALFLTFILIFPLFGCTVTDPEDSLVVFRTTTVTTYDSAKNQTLVTTHEYDQAGNEIRTTQYDSGGKETSRVYYIFNEHNDKVLQTTITPGNDPINYTIEYKYDDQDRQTSRVVYAGDELDWRQTETFKYDAAGNISQRKLYVRYTASATDGVTTYYTYNSEGLKTEQLLEDPLAGKQRTTYSYTNGLLTERQDYYADVPKAREIWQYDENGLLLTNEKYTSNGRAITTNHTYDEAGNLLRVERSEKDSGKTEVWEYTYKNNGREMKCTYYKDSRDFRSTSWEETFYDEDGRVEKCIQVDEQRNEITTTYRYS